MSSSVFSYSQFLFGSFLGLFVMRKRFQVAASWIGLIRLQGPAVLGQQLRGQLLLPVSAQLDTYRRQLDGIAPVRGDWPRYLRPRCQSGRNAKPHGGRCLVQLLLLTGGDGPALKALAHRIESIPHPSPTHGHDTKVWVPPDLEVVSTYRENSNPQVPDDRPDRDHRSEYLPSLGYLFVRVFRSLNGNPDWELVIL